MTFRSFDALKVFDTVARRMSFTRAAEELHVTKGAISYQIRNLEDQLGFKLFHRKPGNLSLTRQGLRLWHISEAALEKIEREISEMKASSNENITVGMTTYFASRWLSPRLMHFTSRFPDIGLRLQPTLGAQNLQNQDMDMMIRWGTGDWQDGIVEKLLHCPAFPTAGRKFKISPIGGLTQNMSSAILLHDDRESDAWQKWFQAAGIDYPENPGELVIPDPNVRVQAVIDGQGLALNDRLIEAEIAANKLVRVSSIELDDYGYFLTYLPNALQNRSLKLFRDWILDEATEQP
jgi:DNA-binding transcriptional LysR family regulator